jgi:polyisoprenoid-binding protein YceI
MVFAKVRGHFTNWTAQVAFDPSDPTQSSIDVSIDAASIDTCDATRDAPLKSADFLDVEKHPKITYKSRRVEPIGAKRFKVRGDLTIRGVTREVALHAEELGRGKDPSGNEGLHFSAKGSINREDFGLKWNQAIETGGVLVGEKVDFEIVVAVRQSK